MMERESYFYKRICCWTKISFSHTLIILVYTVHSQFQVNALFFSAHLLIIFFVCFFAAVIAVAFWDFKWEKTHVSRYQGGSAIAKPLSRITNFLSKSSWIIAHLFIIISFHFHHFITHECVRARSRFHATNRDFKWQNKQNQMV